MKLNRKKGVRAGLLSFIAAFLAAVSFLSFPARATFLAAAPVTVIFNSKSGATAVASLVDSTAYVPLRAFCTAMDETAVISWDERTRTASVATSDLSLSVTVGEKYLVANGRYLYLEQPCYIAGGAAMVPVRVLARAFGASVSWNGELCQVSVTKGCGAIDSGDAWYDKEDLYWLSRIISAEARGESLEGQIAVGNVVLNRVKSPLWPNTVKEVIFDRRCGVQFTPAATGTIYNEPTKNDVIAAKLALDGAQVAGGSLYFLNEAKATSRWIVNNCSYVVKIGSHSFYM